MSNNNNSNSESWFYTGIRSFHKRHERVKKTVHDGFRVPLPPWGRFLMGCFYFSIPLVGGHYVMQWAISKSHESIGERGEKLVVKDIQNLGTHRVDKDGNKKRVGAGGWGGGVKLAVSDEETQKRNRQMLNKYFRKQKRLLEKQQGKTKESGNDSEASR